MSNFSIPTKKKLIGHAVRSITLLFLAADASAAIEEVIVTANKREQSLNDIGETVSVLSYDSMKLKQIVTLEDMAAATPGLSYSRSAQNTPIYTLRGVGFNEMSLGVYPTVSIYQDEAPLTFPAMAAHSAFDLERVEVLKGPQGTLFGQNSTGGAINYIAAKPTEEFEAGISATYGRFDLFDVEAYVSGPLSDTVRGRLAMKSRDMDAWQSSVTRDDENGEEEVKAFRGSLEWEPSENLRLSTSLTSWKDKSEPQAMQFSAISVSIAPDIQAPVLNAPFPNRGNRDADWSVTDPATGESVAPSSDVEMTHAIFRVEWDFTDTLLFTSLTSYIEFDRDAVVDGDGIAAESLDWRSSKGEAESLVQEFRIENTNTEVYRWIAGVNYEHSETLEDLLLEYDENSTSNAANNFISASGLRADNEMNNWAVFANLDYALSEKLNFKVGTRYTESEFEHYNCNYSPNTAITGLFNLLGDIFSGPGTFTPIEVGDCYTLNEQGFPGVPFEDTLNEDNVSWRLGLDYNATEDTLLYVNVSQGYKGGSYPSTAASTYEQYSPVTQEKVLAYEAGLKGEYLDGTARLNAAIFRYDYEDKQIRGRKDDPLFGVLELLRNVPESEITGIEFDAVLLPIDGLTLTAAATFLDSEVTKSPEGAINDLGESTDFTGSDIPFAADTQIQLDAQYEWGLTEGFDAFVGITYNYTDDTISVLNGDKASIPTDEINRTIEGGLYPFVIDSYETIDVRAGIRTTDERWSLVAWGKNVTDEYYWTNILLGDDTLGRLTGRPATYGLTVNYSF